MNDDEIPVLTALREQLVAGIARHGAQRRRVPVAVLAAVAAVLVLAAVVALVTRSSNPNRQVSTVGPAVSDQPAAPSTTLGGGGVVAAPTTALSGGPAPTTTMRPVTTATTVRPAPTTSSTVTTTTLAREAPTTTTTPPAIVLGIDDGTDGRVVTVAPGTTIDVNLDYSGPGCGLGWNAAPSSSDTGVVAYVDGGGPAHSFDAVFRAVAPGTAKLTSAGVEYDPGGQVCPDLAILWTVMITVS